MKMLAPTTMLTGGWMQKSQAPERSVPTKVMLVGSSGGHLAQMLALRPWLEGRQSYWVTFRTADAQSHLVNERVSWAHFPTTRNLPNTVRNLKLAWRDIRRERPELVVSTGAGVAFPYFIVAKLLRRKTAYIEVYDRIDSRTLTAQLCRPLCDLFCVQWEEQRSLYPGAVMIGQLL
jgi:UDP-N-acetylglucosamine:LPS N-acetylglucosamine transferase